MSEKILELEDLLTMGNDGAPEEWLKHLTGEGIGNGYEGIDDDELDTIMAEPEDPNDPFMPNLPIEATPEISFYQCNSANYTSGRGDNKITHIVVHYTSGKPTAAGAALANCKYFNRGSRGASAHYFIDDGYTIWQSVKDKDTAWHAGNWNMNQRAIGIEVCTSGAYTSKEIERLTWLVQHLMKKYSIPASRVIRHYDVTGKKCPAYYVDSARWKKLKTTITTGKKAETTSAKKTETNKKAEPTPAKKDTTFKVDVTVPALNIRKGPGSNYAKTGVIRDKGIYTIVETSGDWGKLKSGAGWINLDFTKKVSPTSNKKKSNTEIAKEVIAGKWGNGEERRKKLEKAGYNYKTIQNKVNELMS